MNYAANIVSIIESVVNQMTPTLTISGVTTNSATSFTVEVCKTYWVHLGQRLTIDGNNYTVTEFESDTNITLKGTVSPGLVSFQLDAPDFWHGSHRKVESERARKKDVTRPVVYLPNTRTTQPGEYDSDIAYTASVRPIFLLNYLKKFDTTELQQSKVIDPAHQMADLFYSIIENDDRFNDPENLRRLEWMNFGDSTTWGNDELIFDQPLSGVELQLDLDVLIYSFCECDDQGEPEICPDVTTTFNGTATGVDTAAGQNISIEVVDDNDTPTGTLTTNTANTKKIVVTGGGPAAPVGIELNGVTPLTDAASGTTRNFDFFDEEDNVVTPIVDTDSSTNTGLLFSDVPMSFNGSATAGALVGGSKSITVQDTDGTQVGTVINDEQLNLTVEVAKGIIKDVYYNRPYLTQITSYNIYDEAWRRLNSGNAYNLAVPQYAPIQSVEYDFTNGRYDYLRYVNSFGHKFRFTGENGGYYDEADGNYYDVNGNLSSLAVEFPIISFGAWWIYDHLTGYRFASKRLGARTWAVAMNDVATWVFDGETNWFNPSADEWAQLSTFGYEGLNIFVGNAIRPFFNFDQSQHWSGTTRQDQTTTAWFKRADEGGRMRSGTKTSSGANRSHFSVFDNGFVTQP